MTARLIAFEGGDGCGKSTQAALLGERLGAVVTREPGGTALGERLRALLVDGDGGALDRRAEALMMAAARAQHVAEVIAPALEAGRDVVVDRFSHSSLAYQGFGRGLPVDEVRWLSDWATGGRWPDVVVLLDLGGRASLVGPDPKDRFEGEDAAFRRRVAEGFLLLAAADPVRWRVVDGDGPIDQVAERVWSAVHR